MLISHDQINALMSFLHDHGVNPMPTRAGPIVTPKGHKAALTSIGQDLLHCVARAEQNRPAAVHAFAYAFAYDGAFMLTPAPHLPGVVLKLCDTLEEACMPELVFNGSLEGQYIRLIRQQACRLIPSYRATPPRYSRARQEQRQFGEQAGTRAEG